MTLPCGHPMQAVVTDPDGTSFCAACEGLGERTLAKSARDAREARSRAETARLLHTLAFSVETMAQAMDDGDDILGVLAGRGITEVLPALPKHVRDVFAENLTDEAARGYCADVAYLAASEASADLGRSLFPESANPEGVR